MVATNLGEHLNVGRLATAGTRARELKERALELGGLGVHGRTGKLGLGKGEEELPVCLAGLAQGVLIVVHHGERLTDLRQLGAYLGAEPAPGAVLNGDL